MAALSPALRIDLDFALSRYGLNVEDVPRDREGKSIEDRLAMLVEGGEPWHGSQFCRTDLRRAGADLWQLFPENPATCDAHNSLIDEASALLEMEREFHEPPRVCIVRYSDLPRREHVEALERLLDYIDGAGREPDYDPAAWLDVTLFEEAEATVPGLRQAESCVRTRAQLVEELASGLVPEMSAVFVRKALDSEDDGLRNADITLAAYQVAAAKLRDGVVGALDALRPHFKVAERIRQVRDDLDHIEQVMHWPGPWQTAPVLREPQTV